MVDSGEVTFTIIEKLSVLRALNSQFTKTPIYQSE
jgi:hypothetical protein